MEVHADPLLVVDEIRECERVGCCTGQVKWWSNARGYGFITVCSSPERGKDVFVHHTGIKPLNSNYKSLRKGEYVNFNTIDGPNGPQAVDVTGIGGGCLMCDILPVRQPLGHQMTLAKNASRAAPTMIRPT
jgi:cold shock protein